MGTVFFLFKKFEIYQRFSISLPLQKTTDQLSLSFLEKISSQKIPKNRSQLLLYYRTTIFLRNQLLELQLQNSLDISICFPSLNPKQQKRYIKKHNHFFMDPKK